MIEQGQDAPRLALDQVELMLPRLARPTHARARLFDLSGELIADSLRLAAAARGVEARALPPPEDIDFSLSWLTGSYDRFMVWVLGSPHLLRYRERFELRTVDFPEIARAIAGERTSFDRLDEWTGT